MAAMLRLSMILFVQLSALATVDVLVQKKQITALDSSGAIAGMSGNARMWFQLLNSSTHPEAFFRYMGSLETGDLLAAIGDASIAEYFNITGPIPGTGRIETRMSLLAFKCLDSRCLSFSPMVLNASTGELYSTWKVEDESRNRSIMVNPTVADMFCEDRESHVTKELGLLEATTIPQCNSNADSLFSYSSAVSDNAGMLAALLGWQQMQIFAFRTAIQAIDPEQGIDGCYKLNLTALKEYGDLVNFDFGNVGDTVMVLGFSISLGGYIQDTAGPSLRSVLAELAHRVNASQCSPRSRVLINNIGESSYTVCSAANDTGISTCSVAVLRVKRQCKGDAVTQVIIRDIRMIKEFFKGCYEVNMMNLTAESAHYRSTLPRIVNVSDVISSSGNARICKRDTGMRLDRDVLQLLLSGVKSTYVEKHNELFELEHGPPTDYWTATITILSSFVAVMTAAGPLTGIELASLRRLSSGFEPPSRHLKLKLTALASFNAVLSFFFYAPALLLASNEVDRQQEYKTWALACDNFGIVLEGETTAGLLLVTGSSVYESRIMPTVVAFAVLSPLAVAAITLLKATRMFSSRVNAEPP